MEISYMLLQIFKGNINLKYLNKLDFFRDLKKEQSYLRKCLEYIPVNGLLRFLRSFPFKYYSFSLINDKKNTQLDLVLRY